MLRILWNILFEVTKVQKNGFYKISVVVRMSGVALSQGTTKTDWIDFV